MATLNLGRIKPVFQGAYNNSTAYVVDDIVTFGDETFICIQASTGNATSNASYWTKLAAKGTNGTDGTDVGTVITTQGDLLYRDGSGLQRLGAGTSGQVLQTGGSGANPSWTNVSSDFVLLGTTDVTSNTASVTFDGLFSSTYKNYKIFGSNVLLSGQTALRFRAMVGNSEYTSGHYYCVQSTTYSNNNGGSADASRDWGTDNFRFTNWDWSSNASSSSAFELTIHDPLKTNNDTNFHAQMMVNNNNYNYVIISNGGYTLSANTALTGIKIYCAQNIARGNFKLYGIK